MSDDAVAGFFGRWSQRKRAAQAGRPLEEPPAATADPGASENQANHPTATPAPATPNAPSTAPSTAPPAASLPAARDLPTLADAQQLTPASDFQPFMSQGVASEVRNAALKKLFTDPHFNVMDGLDIYIGDYNTPDPLPPEMLRKMVGAQFLGLWDEEVPVADPAPSNLISASSSTPPLEAPAAAALQSENDHTDLRLQPNPTPSDPEPEPRPG